ncbi:MAG: sodium:calcium antiporter [Chloroflexi bacterium]|nr:sodium:calcium antiporter [Chloroflexota bacterium]
MESVVALVLSLAVVLLAAELFTNGVEWVGHRLNLGEGVVGSVLAAVGTAMPETLIPIVAIIFYGEVGSEEVGLGAILGAPFMLSTLAMFVTGLAIIIFTGQRRRTTAMRVNPVVLSRDLTFFFVAYGVAIAAALLPSQPFKIGVGIGLLGLYVFYVFRHLADEALSEGEPNPLHLAHWLHHAHGRVSRQPTEELGVLYFLHAGVPRFRFTLLQTISGVLLMIGGAYQFVGAVEELSHAIGIPALLLSLIIAPIATELPEKFNSVLWVRMGKDTLAMGNITGAMVFQSCIPVTIGVIFTDWHLTGATLPAFVSAAVALVSSLVIMMAMRLRGELNAYWLLAGGAFYAVYLGYVLAASL